MLPMKERPTSFICVSETRMCRCQFLKRDIHAQVCAMCVLRVSITTETQLIPESHQPAVTTQPPRQDTWACSAGLPPTPNLYIVEYFSGSVMSDSLQLHGLQHARSPCPSPTPGVYSNSLSQ